MWRFIWPAIAQVPGDAQKAFEEDLLAAFA
jgi:hypothetical protein